MSERALDQNGACCKQQGTGQRCSRPRREQAAEQRTKAALQQKAEKCKPAEILKGAAAECSQRAAEHRQQGDGVGVGHTHAAGGVDGGAYAQRPAQGAVAVKKPTGVMLLNILFNIAAAAEGIVCHIQRRDTVHKQKYGNADKRPQQKQSNFARTQKSILNHGSAFLIIGIENL